MHFLIICKAEAIMLSNILIYNCIRPSLLGVKDLIQVEGVISIWKSELSEKLRPGGKTGKRKE